MSTEIGNHDGFRERLGILVGSQKPFEWAKEAGIPSSTWNRAWNEGVILKADHLAKIARHANVTLDWLITGQGPMRHVAPAVSQPQQADTQLPSNLHNRPLDEDLHASIADGISKTYRDANARLSPADLGRLSARMHGELIDLYDDPADRAVGLKALLRQLQRDLQAPPGKSDKRSA